MPIVQMMMHRRIVQRVRDVVPRMKVSRLTPPHWNTSVYLSASFRFENYQHHIPQKARTFSSTVPSNGIVIMDENQFLNLAEHQLHKILEWSDGIDEMIEDADITLSVSDSV